MAGVVKDRYIYPYMYPIRNLTIEELTCLRDDLVKTNEFVKRYRIIFGGSHLDWSDALNKKYSHIEDTMNVIMRRGQQTEKYNDLEKTPLLVADIDRYLLEVISFAQYRMDPQTLCHINLRFIPTGWHKDQLGLIKMEHEVKHMLLSIDPRISRST